jgi:hypothetical protein
MVDDPEGELKRIIVCPDDPEREEAFQRLLSLEEQCLEKYISKRIPFWQERYGTKFSDARIKLIVRHALEQQTDVEAAVEEIQAVEQAVRNFAGEFSSRNEVEISFTDGAVDCLAERIWKEPQDISDGLKLLLQNYDHGLKLIRERTGQRNFLIPAEGLENPEQFLKRLIQEAYRKH